MSEKETDELFNALDEFLSSEEIPEDEGFSDKDGFLSVVSESADENDEESVEDRTEYVEGTIQPLITEILTICRDAKMPAQFSVQASKSKILTVCVNLELSLQVSAAVSIYQMPHAVSHLVRYASIMPFHPPVEEDSFDKNEDICEQIQEKLGTLISLVKEENIPMQFGCIIHRTREHQEIWSSLIIKEDRHSCLMQAALRLYQVGSSLSFDVMSLASDIAGAIKSSYGDV